MGARKSGGEGIEAATNSTDRLGPRRNSTSRRKKKKTFVARSGGRSVRRSLSGFVALHVVARLATQSWIGGFHAP